jgi:RND family efflux transporter MFP subunit
VTTSPLTETLNLTGDVHGTEEIDVYPKASGKLVQINVREGEKVVPDQVLAVIDRDVEGVKFEPVDVVSPVGGIVGTVYLDQGARVTPPEPSPSMGTPLVRVVNMDTVKVLVNVIEKDFSKIKLNQKALVSVDAYPDEKFAGKVTLISPTIDRMTRTASAEIAVPNRDHRLKPGMFAQVRIVMREIGDALLIPAYAVIEQSQSKKVFILADGMARSNPVELGVDQGEMVEVVSGLVVGDSLIVAGQHKISSGDQVRLLTGGAE